MEVPAMDNFWVFLEAMAGILEDSPDRDDRIQHLQHELRRFPEDERDKKADHLNVVAEGISDLATLNQEDFLRV